MLQKEKNIINDAIIKDISDSIHNLKNGIVTITVRDAKIIQIDIAQRSRFDDVWNVEGGGGI